MKKIITPIAVAIILITLLMLATATTGCAPKANVIPEVSEQPAETTFILPTPAQTLELTPEPSPDPLSEWEIERRELGKKYGFPVMINNEHREDYMELIAFLGEPDKIVDDPEKETETLFYSKYNRVFRSSSAGDYIFDETFLYETVNKINYGMTASEVTKKLGKPSSKFKPNIDHRGVWNQTWTYKNLAGFYI